MFGAFPTTAVIISGITPWVAGLLPEFYPILWFVLATIFIGGIIAILIAGISNLFGR